MSFKNWFESLFQKAAKKTTELPLTDIEQQQKVARWRAYRHSSVVPTKDGVYITTSSGSGLLAKRDRTLFWGRETHLQFKSAMEDAYKAPEYNRALKVTGPEDFKLKVWAYAKFYKVAVVGYAPPAGTEEKVRKLLAEIKAHRDAEHHVTPLPQEPAHPHARTYRPAAPLLPQPSAHPVSGSGRKSASEPALPLIPLSSPAFNNPPPSPYTLRVPAGVPLEELKSSIFEQIGKMVAGRYAGHPGRRPAYQQARPAHKLAA